ncbi:MAG: glycosyltransferase family 4 protein [Gammaproteobacteria bacterium]|nr:glycosyltransferase family 4 protein [Gammaproteobacteria bacterium]
MAAPEARRACRRLLLVIDHFGSGGAQRQMVELACGLKMRGHHVEMFVYFPQHDFFRERIDRLGIVVHEHVKNTRFSPQIIFKLAAVMRAGSFDLVVSYLKNTNIYAELAKLCCGDTKLVVSERTSYLDDRSATAALIRRSLHVIADQVVANSESQADWLRRKKWLRDKVSCIYNGLDLSEFRPNENSGVAPSSSSDMKLLCIGRVGPEKNVLALIDALGSLVKDYGYCPQLRWVGRRDESRAGRNYCLAVDRRLEQLPAVHRNWHWLGLRSDVKFLLGTHDVLVHPSLYEGLPNVVCEALACGMPVLASNVCDHPVLVEDNVRGFLFDPADVGSIAAAINKMAELPFADWQRMSRNARQYAEDALDIQRMLQSYESLVEQLVEDQE